jgi:hypothetical protein
MPNPREVAKEKFNHPIGGPILWALLLWHWPISIDILAAVKEPVSVTTETIKVYLSSCSLLSFLALPLCAGLIYAFLAPIVGAYFQKFQFWIERIQAKNKQESLYLNPVPGKYFQQAIEGFETATKLLENHKETFGNVAELSRQVESGITQTVRRGQFPTMIDLRKMASTSEEARRVSFAASQESFFTDDPNAASIKQKAAESHVWEY